MWNYSQLAQWVVPPTTLGTMTGGGTLFIAGATPQQLMFDIPLYYWTSDSTVTVQAELGAQEAQSGTYTVGVTDGVQVWVVRFGARQVTAYQWAFGPVLTAPAGDANNPFTLTQTNAWATTVLVSASV